MAAVKRDHRRERIEPIPIPHRALQSPIGKIESYDTLDYPADKRMLKNHARGR